MNRRFCCSLVAAAGLVVAALGSPDAAARQATAASAQAGPGSDHRSVINQYCVTCHNQRTKTAGLVLDAVDLSNVPANAELWEKVMRKVRPA